MKFIALLLICLPLPGETRRALVIGINTYEPPDGETAVEIRPDPGSRSLPGRQPRTRGSFQNLYGAVNDARDMRRILIERFHFLPQNIRFMAERDATRAAILEAIPASLAPKDAARGDVALFYYAGHGSQVLNSATREADGLDESFVPADAYKAVPDIRDKELARLFNDVLDRGIVLTVIADSCHSGSIARGAPFARGREMDYDPRDSKDPGDTRRLSPQERGALIVSSTQEDQEAMETGDRLHGVFTWALIKVLETVSPGMAMDVILQQVQSFMRAEGHAQEPVLAGADRSKGIDRTRLTLLGGPPDNDAAAGIMTYDGMLAENHVLLVGGLAAMLNKDCEFVPLSRTAPEVVLRVTKVLDLVRAEAEVVHGERTAIAPATLFELSRWVVPGSDALRVLVPSSPPALASIMAVVRAIDALRKMPDVQWIDDPTTAAQPATHVLSWEANRGWRLDRYSPTAATTMLGASPTVQQIRKALHNAAGGPVRLLVFLPPPAELVGRLHLGPKSKNEAILPVESRSGNPQYLLVGRWQNGKLEYAWVAPDLTETAMENFPLPVRTNWEAVSGASLRQSAEELEGYAVRLEKIRGWLQLSAPPSTGFFPYRLALKSTKTGELNTTGILVEGEGYRVVLKADPADIERAERRSPIAPRYVYVFVIDRQGKSTMIFPPASTGNEGNLVPRQDVNDGKASELVELEADDLYIDEPFGVDTYFLLTTDETKPLPSPGILEFDGVETRGEHRGSGDPLEGLLLGVGSQHLRGPAPLPAKWSVSKISFRSVPKPK